MELTDEARADVAQQMGMKSREIVAAREVDGGLAVTTHDGVTSLLTEDGKVQEYAPPPLEVAKQELAELVQQPPATGSAVPEGSEKEVLDWVGEDRDRAGRALEREQGQDKPRKGLVDKLQKLAG